MSTSQGIFDLPKPMTLSAQAAAAIRKAIENGLWKHHLPSERRLCEYLQVSRPTVRTALQILAKEGLLEIHHGRRNRLLRRRSTARAPQKRLVGLITQEPLAQMTQNAYQGISELRAHLAEHGFVTEMVVCPPVGGRAQLRTLKTFVRANPVFCCVLITVSKEVQRWFAGRSLPALVVGSCHEAVALPSLDVDFRSVCRHAAGVFLGKGHRDLALVLQNSGFAGDLASEEGFREGARQHAVKGDVRALIVRHNGTAQNITAKLDALFRTSRPPTALLVARPWAVFAVIIYLLKHGRSVPDAVSLIARDQDFLFDSVDPAIGHYRLEPGAFVHRLSRLMLKLVSRGDLAPEPHLMIPNFVPGGTVKAISR